MRGNGTATVMMRVGLLATVAFFLFAAKPEADAPTAGGEVSKEDKGTDELPVLKVNDVTINLEALKQVFAQMSPMQLHELKDPARMDDFLDRVVKTELMAEEARRRGYDKDPEVVAIYKNKIASLMHRRFADDADKGEVTDEDLRKYYDEHIEDYHKPEKRRARQIVLADKGKAEAMLKDILDRKVKQQDFRKMAKESTEDEETKKQGGDLGFFTRIADRKEGEPEIDPAIVEAVFTLKTNGDVYPKLIQTDKGYHIVMLTGQRKKVDFSFEDSRERLKVLVKRDKRKEAIESSIEKLKERFPVEVYEENLKYVVIELTGDTPSSEKSGPGRKSPALPSRIGKP